MREYEPPPIKSSVVINSPSPGIITIQGNSGECVVINENDLFRSHEICITLAREATIAELNLARQQLIAAFKSDTEKLLEMPRSDDGKSQLPNYIEEKNCKLPTLATALIYFSAPEEAIGCLEELYHKIVQDRGDREATIWLWCQVIKSVVPFAFTAILRAIKISDLLDWIFKTL